MPHVIEVAHSRKRLIQITIDIATPTRAAAAAVSAAEIGVGDPALGPCRSAVVVVGDAVTRRRPTPVVLLLARRRETEPVPLEIVV